jgi:hypothetical protein
MMTRTKGCPTIEKSIYLAYKLKSLYIIYNFPLIY